MGGTDIHYTKEKRNGAIHFGLPRTKQKDKKEAFPYPENSRFTTKLEGYQFATSLDLNMGYYHIELSPFSHEAMYNCTAVW